MTWSHSGKWLVTTDDRGFIKYWQINFNNVHTFQAHSEAVRSSRWVWLYNSSGCGYIMVVYGCGYIIVLGCGYIILMKPV